MTSIFTGALREMKKKLHDLKLDRVKLEKLCEMSKPIALPEVSFFDFFKFVHLSDFPSNLN